MNIEFPVHHMSFLHILPYRYTESYQGNEVIIFFYLLPDKSNIHIDKIRQIKVRIRICKYWVERGNNTYGDIHCNLLLLQGNTW